MTIKDQTMPVKVTKVYVRENVSTPFYSRTTEDRAHITTTFVDAGKLVSTERTVSADEHELSVVRIFATVADYESFLTDAVIASSKEERITYNSANSIIEYPAIVEEV
jgi:hypothetical protein